MNSYFKESYSRNPFLLPMVIFCLSAFLFNYVAEVNSFIWLLATLFFSISYLWQPKINQYGILLVLFFFGLYRISVSREVDKHFRIPDENHQQIVEVRGMVYAVDSLDLRQTFSAKQQIQFLVEVSDNNWFESTFVKVVVLENTTTDILPGDQVVVTGKFLVPFEKTIPNTFDSRQYYRENKWLGKLQVKSWDAIEKNGTSLTWRRWVHIGRKYFYHNLKNSLTPASAALIASVVLGYTTDVDAGLLLDFQRWGIAHIFSVSGLHLGLVGFWVWLISGFFIISLRKRTALTIITTFLYCLASGMAVATLRSLIMLICFLSGYLVNRRTSMWNNFSAAFALLFIWDPRNVYTPGFQLSFMAVAAILITQEILSRRKPPSGVEIVLPNNRWKAFRHKLGEWVFYPMMISAATLGVTAYHFQVISFGSVFLNLIIVPIFSIIMVMSFIYIPFLFFIPHWMSWPLEKVCELFMNLPNKITGGSGLFTFVQTPAPWLIFMLFLFFCILAIPKLSVKKTVVLFVCYFFFAQGVLLYQGQPPSNRLVMIDVGKASACFVQNKAGENLLFDCGTVTGFDMISPYLRGEGINRLQAVVISHDNYDHFSCWPKIFKNTKIEKVWRNQEHEGLSNDFQLLENYCTQEKIPLNNAYQDDQLDFQSEQWRGVVLHPAKEFISNKNDESMIVLLQTSWCEVLFPGDAQEIYGQLTKNKLPNKIKPRILIFPHHGRNIKAAEDLLKWFQPDLILISGNIITEDVNKALASAKIPWLITSEKGTIEVLPGLKVKSYKSGRWLEP